MRRSVLAAVLLFASSAWAQTTGTASFVVYEKSQRIGTVETNVSRFNDGWRVQGTMETNGSVPIRIVNLDLVYDRQWFGRWMTMEMKQPDDVIVHVAVGRTTAQVDVVRSREAGFRSHSSSPNTILLPERAYGAYEAVAARLAGGATDLPLFVAPTGETRALVDSVATEQVQTTRGSVSARHFVLTEVGRRPARVDVWVEGGRLLRLDVPQLQISVIRSDVKR